ncbi:hypothetical protein P691DRAFT_759711 [Macrolepiota fuliginosa MF-IS2]|uniref:Nuclear pore complex protein n=1 Tax=Macrolepiota fuliginosa MF-IS2 TaxID=1400762 RepID=A0A9P5XFS9_9AGAR|nr:hypothetical protein P691DRAFT_759711 [Macrolepiota fuliginosa MF-IS2]
MSDALHRSCADVLSVCQSAKDVLEALLDPELEFAAHLRQLCRDQLEEYEETCDDLFSNEELELLRLEENTWGLLQAVMSARKTEVPTRKTPRDLLNENPYTPTATIAQVLMDTSLLFAELVVARE